MKKQFLSIVLVCLMIIGMFPIKAQAASIVDSGYYNDNRALPWTLDSDGVLTVSGEGAMKPVRYSLHPFGWLDRRLIKTIIIESGITSIGDYAFSNCENLASVSIPNTVTSIGSYAFANCGFASITIPNSVTSIGEAAFSGCDNLESVTIPASVTQIGNDGFGACTALTDVTFAKGSRLAEIGYSAFAKCERLESIILPSAVSTIGDMIFQDCSALSDVTFSEGSKLTEISDLAFRRCTNLYSIIIPNGVTSIGELAFSECQNLKTVIIPDSVTSIGGSAFYACQSFETVKIPASVTNIDDGAFEECYNLTEVSFAANSNLKSIGNNVFYHSFFYSKSPVRMTIPDSVTTIGDSAFCGCAGLTSVAIGSGVENIGCLAFYQCYGLTSVIIPHSVTNIGEGAFNFCRELTDVFYVGTEAEWSRISIDESNSPLQQAKLHYVSSAEAKAIQFGTANIFSDVTVDDAFFGPVMWAVENSITNGTDDTHFSPADAVTRGQMMTFLWRAAGRPEPSATTCQFVDVQQGAYYDKAVLWAVENGITNGTDEAHFSPNADITRGQVITFLARFAGVKDGQTVTSFTDVNATDYFAAAVQWAKDSGMTEPSETMFRPMELCPRAQVVTFLYRWFVK